ncbi:MAG TPA: hypothetical protein DEB15_08230 [Pusillimonas sp.]|nr:hypothetical protein [Pusillimonas sp.]MBC40938.1 hypothetical protein [Pusillimonas sp.]HBT32814.1 hypothetical protein [Pusillimonas sp.]HCN72424.1 hypothetical protein [Pusillimonas sp.]HCP79460.1 hypothetical protein [Pusillimonas sp.]
MQTTKTVLVVNSQVFRVMFIAALGLDLLSFGTSRRTDLVYLYYVRTNHPPGSLKGQKREQKDQHEFFHCGEIIPVLHH